MPQTAVLVCVSAGPDSVCLLHIMWALSYQFDLRLGIGHLHHGLRRPDADRESEHVCALADKLKLPYFTQKVDVRQTARITKTSLEEAGRLERYNFFEEIAVSHKFDRIALGHHGDDNAELVLMNLLRGAGPKGLSGIPAVRGKIIRPLIRASRDEIMQYLKNNRLKYFLDHSNTDPAFKRNKIRHELMPLLKNEYNPNITPILNRLSDISCVEEQWINGLIQSTLDQLTLSANKNELVLSVSGLQKRHTAELRRIFRAGIKQIKGDLRRIRLSHITAAIDILFSPQSTAWIDLPDQIRLEKTNKKFSIRREPMKLRALKPDTTRNTYRYLISLENLPVQLWMPEIQKTLFFTKVPGGCLPKIPSALPSVEFLDLDRLQSPLIIRNPEPGDKFIPIGMTGSQKIKDYFINNKVPEPDRASYPVIISSQQIIWLAGHRISDKVKLTARSKHILRAELKPAGL